jgi:hypothetical protein
VKKRTGNERYAVAPPKKNYDLVMFAGLQGLKNPYLYTCNQMCADTFPGVEATILQFWRDFVETLPGGQDRPETPANVFAFGDSKELAAELAMLVRQGGKTATCSALWSYEEEQKPLPRKGTTRLFWMGTMFQCLDLHVLFRGALHDQIRVP